VWGGGGGGGEGWVGVKTTTPPPPPEKGFTMGGQAKERGRKKRVMGTFWPAKESEKSEITLDLQHQGLGRAKKGMIKLSASMEGDRRTRKKISRCRRKRSRNSVVPRQPEEGRKTES